MSTLNLPSKPSKWRKSSKSSKRPSEAAISEIHFSPLTSSNSFPGDRMSALMGYTINPAFSDVFSTSKTNEAMLSTIASTDLTKSQRKPRKPSVKDEAALYQAIKHLSSMNSKTESALTVQELIAWRTAVNIAYMTFTEDGVVPITNSSKVEFQKNAMNANRPSLPNSSPTMTTLSKSKSFSIPRKPVPSSIPELPKELSKTVTSRPKAPRKYSLPNGHNALIDSPKLRSGLPIGQMHALDVDRNEISPTSSIAADLEWNKIQIQNDTISSLIESPPDTSNTATFDMNEWSMVTPKANSTTHSERNITKSATQLSYLNGNGFTKEQCESSKMKRLPDVSGEMENIDTNSDYGDDASSAFSSLDHSNATLSNFSSPRTEEAHLQEFNPSSRTDVNPNKADKVGQNENENETAKVTANTPCRIRVPQSVKRSIRDQRWAPGAHHRLSVDDDSDDEDDFDSFALNKKPIRKVQSRKNEMLGMLDFLESGPP